jgi:cytochrome c5
MAMHFNVMAGVVPAIHDLNSCKTQDVDARHKAGHDGGEGGAPVIEQRKPWMARIKQGMARQTNAVIRSSRDAICYFHRSKH